MKAMELDFDQVYAAAQHMERTGGSFTASIARALYVADSVNRTRLLIAFDDLFCKHYKEVRRDQRIAQLDWNNEGDRE